MAEVRQLLFILTSIWFFCFESNLDQTWWDCSIHWIVTVIIKITDQNKERKKFLSIFFAIIWVVKRRFLAIVYIVFRVVTSIYLHVSLDEIVFCVVTKNKAEIDELLGQTIIRSLSTIVWSAFIVRADYRSLWSHHLKK